MFNPFLKKCDLITNVVLRKPNCAMDPGETDVPDFASGEKVVVTRKPSTAFIVGPTLPVFVTEHTLDVFATPSYFTVCNPSTELKVEHPESCYQYLECLKISNGSFFYSEKSCGNNLMFDPKTKTCDAIDKVILVKSLCGTPKQNLTVDDLFVPTTKKPGLVPAHSRPVKVSTPIIIKATATPPLQCDESSMDPLLHYLPDSSFTASSFLSKAFKPEEARLDSRPSDGSVSCFI